MPLDIMQMTERCEDLERVGKVIGFQLSFNVMKRSEDFVDGLTTIRSIEQNLCDIKTGVS